MAVTVDREINAHLGLPDDYQIDSMEAFKLWQYLYKLFPAEKVETPTLEFYVDKHGDFVNKPKTKRDYVLKAIFDNTDKGDQFTILSYIQYYIETNGFTRPQ